MNFNFSRRDKLFMLLYGMLYAYLLYVTYYIG